jgi:hypothetical protein
MTEAAPLALGRNSAASGVVLGLVLALVLWLLGLVAPGLLLPYLILFAVVLGVLFGLPATLLERRIRDRSRSPGARTAPGGPTRPPTWSPRQVFAVYETAKEGDVWSAFAEQRVEPRLLLGFTRDPPAAVKATYGLADATLYRVSRLEGEGVIAPSDADRLGFLLEQHFGQGPGRVAILPGVETLVEAGNLRSVRRLLELGREKAMEHQGAFLVSLDPNSLSVEQKAVLERDAVRLVYS